MTEVISVNRGIFSALVAILIAQFLKIPLKQKKTKTWSWSNFFESGGMPSSHSAGVAALSTYTGLRIGVKSLDFAISVIYGLIVMYDAQGVRRNAGETSIKVNKLEDKIEQIAGEPTHSYHEHKEQELKEALGHQPIEVAVGALLGMFVGGVSYLMDQNKR